MFVSKRRFILKTCGTTLLLQALVPLLELAREYSGFDSIQVKYQRCCIFFRMYKKLLNNSLFTDFMEYSETSVAI